MLRSRANPDEAVLAPGFALRAQFSKLIAAARTFAAQIPSAYTIDLQNRPSEILLFLRGHVTAPNPAAGKPVDPASLVNVPRLVTAYFVNKPDPAEPNADMPPERWAPEKDLRQT
jgi:hypothetical protein